MDRFPVLFYIVRSGKSSFIKIGKKNLQICQVEVNGPVGGKILIQQIAEVYDKGLSGYLEDLPEPVSGEIVRFETAYCKCFRYIWSFGVKKAG